MPARLLPQDKQTHKHAKNREAASKSYVAHAADVQKRKLIAGILKGTRKNVSAKTLEKYGLRANDKGELIVPPEYMPQPKITVVPQDPKELVVKGVPAVVEKVDHTMKEGPVTSQDVYDYITTKLNDDRVKDGKKPIEVKKLGGALKNIFKKLGFVKTYAEDIMPHIRDFEKVSAKIKDRAPSKTSETKDFQHVFYIAKYVPMVRDQVPISLWKDQYGKQLGAGNKELKDTRYDNLSEKSVYKWTDMVDSVGKVFGKASEEYLFFKVFEEAPIRSEIANIEIRPISKKGKEKVIDKGNYLAVSEDGMVLHLNQYKTDRFYGKKVFPFSKPLVKLIVASLKSDPERAKLFELNTGINEYIRTILDDAGFPNFPYGPEQTKGDKDNAIAGLRHSFATFANSDYNKNGKYFKERELADRMLHDVEQSHLSYRNRSFFTKKDTKAHLKV